MSATTAGLRRTLLEDGSLVVRADAETEAQVRYWLPRLPAGPVDPAGVRASIDLRLVDDAPDAPDAPPSPPALALGPVRAWLSEAPARMVFHAQDRAVAGAIDFARLRAEIGVSRAAATAERPHPGIYSALTVSAALLLNRMRRALLHGAAVVAPDGRAWLLVGDAFAGKTTTTVNLVAGGWAYLSDDHVVLGRGLDGLPSVEGWPRAFHLDRGYRSGITTGEREAIDPADLGADRWRRSAPIAGALFPTVVADRPTRIAPIAPADALARLIRQSPWLLADRSVAGDVLALLSDIGSRPAFALRLGRDSYRDPVRLLSVLATATNPK
ncbi:MAG TPA: hypothetical protein VF158_16125 [Longimicrobiales bacterium]